MAADYPRGFMKHFPSAFRLRSKEKRAGGGAYDDVLITPPSFTPLCRDYAEIFNSPQASSIPFLELDQLGVDHSSSMVDYGNVFGDGQIGWTHVFCAADGARRTDESLSHFRGSDHSTALEESQKQYLFGSKHNMSSDIILREEKSEEKAKNIGVSLSIHATYETVPLKSAEVNTSGAAVKDLKRCSDEALGRKHSRSISPAGLSRCETEEFIEIDVRSRTEYVPDKSVSSDKSIEADIVRSEEQTFEAITPSDFVLDFGSPNHPFKEQGSLRSNLSEDQCDVSTSSSQEVVKIGSLEKPFIRDSATDDNASRRNPLSQDHGGACGTPEMLTGNLNACSSNASEKTGDGSYNSHQDVKFQAASGLRLPFISSNQINAKVAIPQELFELAPQTHSQHDFGKLNTASEEDIVSKIVVSRNTYSECNDRADLQNKVLDELTSIDFPVGTEVINLESQSSETISPSAVHCNLSYVDPALKISTKLQSGVFEKRSDSSSPDDHVRSSSDDEIDKNSEAGIYVSAVKKAIREAQVWIKIAKESDGVKGFMKPAVTKTFGQVKEFKEMRDSKVKEISKCFELGQTSIADNFRMSATRKEYIDPRSTSSETKTTLTNNDREDIAFKRAVFSVPDTQQQKADVVVDSYLEEKLEVASTIQYVTPCINISEEKLTMINDNECLKSVPEKGDATMLGMGESGHFGMVDEAKSYEVPKVEKTEILVIPTDNHDAPFNNFDDTNTVTGINDTENACHHTKNLRGQGFMKSSFRNDFGQSPVGWSAIDIEVKHLVSGTGNMTVHPKQNEGINADSESNGTPSSGNFENDLTNLEGRVDEMHLDSHGQVFDSEDFLGYASAEEDLVSSDTDDEIKGKDSNLPAQYQISEIEDPAMQNMVAPEVISIREDAFGPCFSNLREEPAVEESCESETVPLQNTVTHETKVTPKEMAALILVNSTEDLVVGEGDEKDGKQLQTTGTYSVASEAMTELFFKISENYAVGKDTGGIVDVSILNSFTPETNTNTSEDGMAPGFNCVDEYPRVENTDGVEAMIGRNMVIPEENNISMIDNDVFLSFDHSNVDLMVAQIEADTPRESIVSSLNQEFNGVAGDKTSCIPEYKKLAIEELESAPSVEFAPIVDYAHPYSDGSEAEPIRIDSVTREYVAHTDEDCRSLSRIHDDEKQEMEAACFSDLDSRTQDGKESHAIGIIEAEIIEKGHETKNVKSFINDQASVDDAAAQQDAIDSETIPLYPERDTHEVEAGINFCSPLSDIITNDDTIELEEQGENWISEPVEERINFCERLSDIIMNDETTEVEQQGDHRISEPVDSVLEPENQLGEPLRDTIKSKATCEFEKQGGNSVQPVERHERKKWEIPKESFECLETKVGILEIQHTGEKDTIEVKRQMDKHARKKWEIPVETFELPVLGGNGILEEEEEIEEQERDNSTKSAEKPGRKKWKVQKEVYEAPVICGEAVGQTSGQDGLVVITASEEEMMMYTLPANLMHSEETSQEYIFQNEIFAKEELVVPVNGVSSGFCVDSLEACLTKKSLSGMKILDEEEKEKHLNKTSDRLEEEVEEGKSDKQGECAKVCEDVNMKDEIKRTLGMLWKRMYKSKHDEDFETVELGAQEEEVFARVMDKDLNLNGPVELVESPKQQDGIAFFGFSGQSSGSNNNTEETSHLKQFEVNGSNFCSGAEFASIARVTVEVHGNISSASDSCELQEDWKKSWANETCKQNYKNKASDPASHSEDIRPSNGSENLIEMAQTHGADELQHGQAPQTDIFPSDVNECGRIDCEIMSRFETLLPDESFKRDAENAQKVNLVLQENESKEDETIKTISMGKALQENDGEHYSEGEVEALLADEISDRTSTNTDQQDTTSRRQDSVSALECRVADGMPSHEPKPNCKDEFGPDSSWKWLFREEEESRNKSTKQNEASEISLSPKEKADIRKLAGEINMSQLTVKEKLDDENSSKAEVRAKEGFHKEVTLNHEVLQNILRTKERESVAVERAIRMAFAEAREGADMEKGEAEARQKSAISKQEKLEKALIETKLAAEEISLETKQKAELERAAVERATAEARQRALEKELSQKDQTFQSSSSGFADASDYHYGSTSEDKHNEGGSSESALRFKVTNERHQRIAERTAKALDEKNMRDLLVQREQAERNSLADVLDAEVKIWANGKTGNLRALLATLQYVLDPDSGWKPIHLTDIVAIDALKKAYRKATLCVHPDKLQQRGANIKQKYMCEKVFDLLKEAWKRVDQDES